MDQRFSVVMPVRNALPYLDEAVHSVLAQSCGNFEFVIGDDGSTDGSRERLREWAGRDGRIRLIENAGGGLGPAGSSNWVAMEAACPIVARMDADDISRPNRFRRELEALRDNPDAVLVGSLFEWIDAKGRRTRTHDRSLLLDPGIRPPFAHGSIMYRREAFDRIGGYRDHCDYFEDIDLYYRIAREGRLLVIADPLFAYRFSGGSARLNARALKVEEALDYFVRCLAKFPHPGDPFPIAERGGGRRRIAPEVVRSMGALRLWSGQRPALFGRLLRRADLGWNRGSAAALAWTLWASVSPESLRAILRLRAKWRDAAAGRKVDDRRIHEWRPLSAAAPGRPLDLDLNSPAVTATAG